VAKAPTSSDQARASTGLPPGPGNSVVPFNEAMEKRFTDIERMTPTFVAMSSSKELARRIAADAMTAIRNNPKLVYCTKETFLPAVATCVQLDLRPIPVLGQCFIIPYRNSLLSREAGTDVYEAQFQLGYKGMVTLGHRSGVALLARHVYEGDQFEVEYGLDERLWHMPTFDPAQRGGYTHHYCVARTLAGHRMFWPMSDLEVQEVRNATQQWKIGGPDVPWRKFYGPMALKTPTRRLAIAWTPTNSPELAMGVAADMQVRAEIDPEALEQMTPIGESGPEDLWVSSGPEDYTRADIDVPPPAEAEPQREQVTVTRPQPTKAEQPAKAERGEKEPQSPPLRPPNTKKRRELMARLREVHGPGAPGAAAVRMASGGLTADWATEEQLQKAIETPPEEVAAWQQDQAFAAQVAQEQQP
jgi:recombination protein RecT